MTDFAHEIAQWIIQTHSEPLDEDAIARASRDEMIALARMSRRRVMTHFGDGISDAIWREVYAILLAEPERAREFIEARDELDERWSHQDAENERERLDHLARQYALRLPESRTMLLGVAMELGDRGRYRVPGRIVRNDDGSLKRWERPRLVRDADEAVHAWQAWASTSITAKVVS